MSTTLIPPTHYEVRPHGRRPRPLETIAQVADALFRSRPQAHAVIAVTGGRRRSLNNSELRQLGQELRALRLRAEAREAHG